MTKDLKCCLPGDTIARAAEIMSAENVGPVPVVTDRSTNRLAGIVTDRDIAIKVVAAGRNPRTTRVSEVMSKNIVSCRAEDEYAEALQAMARRQVRRIPVVSDDRALLGIISQADVARRSSEEELGAIVEEISEPAANGHAHGSLKPGSGHNGKSEISGPNMLLMGAACLSAGAGIMFLLDPNRGRSRRAQAIDKAASLYNESGDFAGKVQRDLRNRVAGIAASAKGMLKSEDKAADQKVEARVRTRLGRVVSHPRAICVTARNGCVTLEGPVLANELDALVSAVQALPGVTEVQNRLQAHAAPGNVPELQGDVVRPRERSEFMQANWSPAARLLASALGGGLVVYGMRANGPIAKATATVGAGLIARGVSNKPTDEWTDLSAARRIFGL